MLKKNLPYTLAAIVVALGVVSLLFYRSFYLPRQPKSSGEVEFRNELGVGEIKFHSQSAVGIAADLGIWEKGVWDWSVVGEGSEEVLYPEKIVIVLTGEEQKFSPIKGKFEKETGLETIISLGQGLNDKKSEVFLKVYISPKYISIARREEILNSLEYYATLGLYKMSAANERRIILPDRRSEQLDKEAQIIKSLIAQKRHFFS